jgi:hypothetical protein
MAGILAAILSDPEALQSRRVEQIVAICGDGGLTDGSSCSAEFRDFLKNVPSRILRKYADECLDGSATRSSNTGLALQDIVNEVGERLGFKVEPGYYRGSITRIGNDGLWSSQGFGFVVEVKTSDLSVKLENITRYRERLVEEQRITEASSSVLIVLGRQDTGDLEAQIRGSRYAWDIRMIGTEALFRLLEIKENLNQPQTIHRITELLKPIEYTRVDKLIEVVFSTSSDASEPVSEEMVPEKSTGERPAPPERRRPEGADTEARTHASPVNFYEGCINRINQELQKHFIKNGRVTYTSSDRTTNLVLLNSKAYDEDRGHSFWYGFRPNQGTFLAEGESSYVAFGCGSENAIILMPFQKLKPLLPRLLETRDEHDELVHRHVYIVEMNSRYRMKVGEDSIDITQHVI